MCYGYFAAVSGVADAVEAANVATAVAESVVVAVDATAVAVAANGGIRSSGGDNAAAARLPYDDAVAVVLLPTFAVPLLLR